jgi:hypothetical protein
MATARESRATLPAIVGPQGQTTMPCAISGPAFNFKKHRTLGRQRQDRRLLRQSLDCSRSQLLPLAFHLSSGMMISGIAVFPVARFTWVS